VITSGGYGFRTKKSLAFAYVKSDLANGEILEIEIQGKRRKAQILDEIVYDPENKKLRS
jgi:dimethylglycine dehydrogenase